MVKFNLLFALLITPLVCFGQNAYDYYGEKVQLEAHYFQSQNAGKLQGDKSCRIKVWTSAMVTP